MYAFPGNNALAMVMLMQRPERTGLGRGVSGVPPGQYVTAKMPVMTFGVTPRLEQAAWRLRVTGLVKNPVELDWDGFMAMPQTAVDAAFHCVTQWSRLQNAWEGVRVTDVLELAEPLLEARHVMAHCADGYTTNVDLEVLSRPESLLAHRHDGALLAADHGAPVRLVVPSRYGWKSAKWVHTLELMAADAPGFWEQNGYHMRGDPWREERFWG